MATPFTHRRLTDVEDSAPRFGFGEIQEARCAHKHDEAEEIYVIIAGWWQD